MSNSTKRIASKGLFAQIIDSFFASFSISSRRRVIGKDHLGNIYYEADPKYTKRHAKQRGYVPGNSVDWREIPTEWNSWLRGQRRTPPTQEEIDRNAEIMKIKQQRAAELENRRMLENAQAAKIEGVEDLQKLYTPVNAEDSKELAAISDNRSKLPDIQSSPSSGNFEQKAAFPRYHEYETIPGVKWTDEQQNQFKKK